MTLWTNKPIHLTLTRRPFGRRLRAGDFCVRWSRLYQGAIYELLVGKHRHDLAHVTCLGRWAKAHPTLLGSFATQTSAGIKYGGPGIQ